MNFLEVKKQASTLFSHAEFLVHIKNEEGKSWKIMGSANLKYLYRTF